MRSAAAQIQSAGAEVNMEAPGLLSGLRVSVCTLKDPQTGSQNALSRLHETNVEEL